MAAPSRRVHVALVDPLPAGLEILNPELAVTAELPLDPSRSQGKRRWLGSWYQHQNLRDERAEAFTSYLWAGVYEYTYLARATTPGAFVAPPPRQKKCTRRKRSGERERTELLLRSLKSKWRLAKSGPCTIGRRRGDKNAAQKSDQRKLRLLWQGVHAVGHDSPSANVCSTGQHV